MNMENPEINSNCYLNSNNNLDAELINHNETQKNNDNSNSLINNKTISLDNLFSFFRAYMYFFISGLAILTSFFFYHGYIFGFLMGILFTISAQIVLIFFIFGFKIAEDSDIQIQQTFENPHLIKSCDENEISAEERNNDIKIFYKTIAKKNLSNLDKNNNNELSLGNLSSAERKEKSLFPDVPADEIHKIDNAELDLNHFNIDHTYYCYCKFMPENFEKLIKMQNDIINNYSDSTVKSLTDTMNNLKLFQNIFKKNCLYNSQFKTIEIAFEKEKAYSINYDSILKSTEEFNDDINFFKNMYLKSTDVIDTIHNLVISNLKGVNSQSITEKNHFFKTIKIMITDVNSKENNLRQTLEKYYTHKKLIEKLTNNLENSKINSAKYEQIVKIEMQIKIATKLLNEIQTTLSLAADNYKESRIKFSENSLKIYLNFMKNITREYEVLRALLLSFFDFFKELVCSFKPGIFNKQKDLETSINIYFVNYKRSNDIEIINALFTEFINEYFMNVDRIKIQFFNVNLKNFNSNNESRRINNSFNGENYFNENKNHRLDVSNKGLVDLDKRLITNEFTISPFKIENEKKLINEDCYFIENPEVLEIREDNLMKEKNKLTAHISSSLNTLKDFFETKINFIKKNSTLLKNYVVFSKQIINAFTEYSLQNKKMRKSKIHYFFQMFNSEHINEFDQNDSINLNLIFIKIFSITNKISEDVYNHKADFNKNVSQILNLFESEDKKNGEMFKFINEKFNFYILEAEKTYKKFLNEVNSLNKEKINNKNLFELKVKKIAENFLIRKNIFNEEIKLYFDVCDDFIKKIDERIKSFNQEFSCLKFNLVNSFNKNCSIFINILEKSSKQLSNCYNIEEEINNIPKLKDKINNEILELILFNKDYKLDFIHDKKCNYHKKLDLQNFNSIDKLPDKSPIKNEINLLNENNNLTQNQMLFKENSPEVKQNSILQEDINNNKNEEINNKLTSNNSKIKNSYFQKIKNFILKKTSNSKINNLQSNKDNQKISNNSINSKASTGEIIRDIEEIISHIETKEKGYENYSINNQGYLMKEEAHWFNKLLETFFQRWKENDFFKKWFKRLLYRIYNKKRPQNLDTIWIDDVQFSGSPPVLKVFKEIDFERTSPCEFLYDVDISYKGITKLYLSTTLMMKIPYINKNVNIPLNIEISILSLNGIIRLYYNGNQGAESWYAFLGEPVINFDINIIIGENFKLDINVLKIKNFLKRSFKNKFRKYSLPNKRPLTIPLTIDPSTLGMPDKVGNPKK